MSIEVSNESGIDVSEEELISIARFVIRKMKVHPAAELSMVLLDTSAMADLHMRWMDLPGPTDVMSFPMDELEPGGRPDAAEPGPSMLGDIVLCFQAFHEIRLAHPDARIVLLTMPAFADFARSMPWFDEVLVDSRAPAWRMDAWWRLVRSVQRFNPTRVYDLQGKFRQNILFGLLGMPEWSGASPLCSHPRLWPPLPKMHFTEFVEAQLRRANVPSAPPPDLKWLDAALDVELPKKFVVIIPGCGAGRDYKRWSAESYAELARRLQEKGFGVVAIGTAADAESIQAVRALAPDIVDLTGQTSLYQLGHLARRATAVVGNDSGPTHLMAAVGAPTLALISERVNADWSSPRGAQANWLQGRPLAELSVDKVFVALSAWVDRKKN